MTSSLVGSEMCIRDRNKYVVVALPQLFQTNSNGHVALLRVDVPGFKAVSYTHLTLPTICSV
eukprot:10720010-Prorocentrum_lima.AAC.1